MTQDAMQRRYDALNALEHPTREETTEAVYLYYKIYPDGIRSFARRNLMPEQVYGIVWCETCERAHVTGRCSASF